MINEQEKLSFAIKLKEFAASLPSKITMNDEWTIRGFIDIFKNVYTVSSDTKIISKILELHLFPYFVSFAEDIDYKIELAEHQNHYPDLTFIKKNDTKIKFAVDLKCSVWAQATAFFKSIYHKNSKPSSTYRISAKNQQLVIYMSII